VGALTFKTTLQTCGPAAKPLEMLHAGKTIS
jgi:hypothetical protein